MFPFAAVLNDDQKKDISRNSRRGVPIERLARQYCRTKQSVYRIVSEMRANRLLEQPIEYMDSPEFHKPNAETVIMGQAPPATRLDGRVKAPRGCRRTWPACTRSRCSRASRKATTSAR